MMARFTLAALAAAAAVAPAAFAAPLEPLVCDSLKTERARLAASGDMALHMARGPEWARANLDPGTLKSIQEFIELEEKIAFRCPRPKPPPQPKDANAKPGEKTGQKKTGTTHVLPGVTETGAQGEGRKAVKIEVKGRDGAGSATGQSQPAASQHVKPAPKPATPSRTTSSGQEKRSTSRN